MFSFLAKDVSLGLDFCKISDARYEPIENNPRCLVYSKKKNKKNLTAWFNSWVGAQPSSWELSTLRNRSILIVSSLRPELTVKPKFLFVSAVYVWLWLKSKPGPGAGLAEMENQDSNPYPHRRLSHMASCRHVDVWHASIKIQSLN